VTASNQVKLKPGDTIGILGGGQLGRMLATAAARLAAWRKQQTDAVAERPEGSA